MGDPSLDLFPEAWEKQPLMEILNSWVNKSENLRFVERFLEAVEKKDGKDATLRILNKPGDWGVTPLMASIDSSGTEVLKVRKLF